MTDASPQPLKIDDAIKSAINGAFAARKFVVVAYVGADGYAHMSFRGTTQVFGPQQLAVWARKPDDGLAQSILDRPQLTFFYADIVDRQFYTFYGRGHIATDEAVRTQIFDASPELEQSRDPERKGVAIVVDVDRVEAAGTRNFVASR